MKSLLCRFAILTCVLFSLTQCAKPIYDLTGSIYGTITDAKTGAPVRNAEIVLTPGNISSVSGSAGNFEYLSLQPGQYKLSVIAYGYTYNTKQVNVVAGQQTICDMLLYPEEMTSGVEFSATTLNFGSQYEELALEIRNNGNAGDISWTITGIDVPWLSVSPSEGVVPMGNSQSVKVRINRTSIITDEVTFFNVNAAGGSQSIKVQVSAGQGGGGSDNGGSDSGENVTNGLYAHYKFEGDCKNSADGAPSAQPINSPSYVDGVSGGKALKFSVSDNSYISVPEPMIDGGTYSISFWVKGLSDGHIFHVVSSGQYGLGFVLTMRDGALTFMSDGYEFVYQYNNVTSFAHPAIDSSKWTMVTLTSKYTSGVEKSEVKLYLNGEYVDVINEEGVGYQNVNYGTKFVFGGEVEYYGGSMRSCGMSIDNLRVYDNRVLTTSEVEKIYNYEK